MTVVCASRTDFEYGLPRRAVALLAMIWTGYPDCHCEGALRPWQSQNHQIRTNSFVCAVRRFAVGDVCERRLWRMKRAKSSGRIKAIGKQALPAQTEPLIQQDEACLHPTAVYRWHSVGRGHAPAGAGTTDFVQICSFVPSAASRSGTFASAACGGRSEQKGVAESRRLASVLRTR